MPIEFELENHLVGFAGATVMGGDEVPVIYREYLAPTDPVLLERLENFQRSIFARIPKLPSPSQVDHLLVIIRPDLSAVAYVNELQITAEIKPNRSIKKGEVIRVADVADIASVDLGVDIPDDAAFIFLRTFGWRRSIVYDLGPLQAEPVPRDYAVQRAFAEQALLLMGLAVREGESNASRLQKMRDGLEKLDRLLSDRVSVEADYQELLEEHPWMLGGGYDRIERHTKLDDERIPDFTGRRSTDLHHDIIEIKQPFLPLFRQSGDFRAAFNDAWNQAEGYLAFTRRQRTYLAEEKGLAFENPQAILIVGHELTEPQRRRIREKESLSPLISVRTYEEVRRTARHLLDLVETATERDVP